MAEKNNVTVVDFTAEEPVEPTWKNLYEHKVDQAEARRIWRETCSELRRMGCLSPGNGFAIRRYVVVALAYFREEQITAKGGSLKFGKDFGEPYHSPHWTVLKSCDETLRQLESELCIAPLRRSRAGKVQRRVTKARPADAYLRPSNN